MIMLPLPSEPAPILQSGALLQRGRMPPTETQRRREADQAAAWSASWRTWRRDIRPQRRGKVVASTREHYKAGTGYGLRGGPSGTQAQDGILVAMQDKNGLAQLAQPRTVPGGADLPALRIPVAGSAVYLALDPLEGGIFVEGVGRGGEVAGQHERELNVAFSTLGKLGPREPGQQAEAHMPCSCDTSRVTGHGHGRHDTADAAGVTERDALGDHPAKRGAEDVRLFPSERVEHGNCVVGHVLGGIGALFAGQRDERVAAGGAWHAG